MNLRDLPPALGCTHCLVVIYMFSGWTEHYLITLVVATIVVKKLITEVHGVAELDTTERLN